MNILIAFDGSSYSENAVNMLIELTSPEDAEVTLLTVIPRLKFLGGHTLDRFKHRSKVNIIKEQKLHDESALELLRMPLKRLIENKFQTQTMVSRGVPAQEILKTCKDIKADLVVLGVKGTGQTDEFLMGCVTQKVVKYAPCSVLVVGKETLNINQVILPLDGSRHSSETIRFLIDLPLSYRTQIIPISVAHFFPSSIIGSPTLNFEENQLIYAELQKAEDETAINIVRKAEADFHKYGYHASGIVARGDPSKEILREAEKRNVDLIAVGAKGQTGVRGFLLGSVSQRVVRHAKCSVLLVRTKKYT